jgi:mitogen-activated protein kinase 15
MSDDIDKHVSRRFEVQQKLGKGAYGIVWKALEKKTKEQVALKKVFDAFQNSTDAQRTYREVVYLLQMDHENIIKLNSVIKADNDKDLYLVFEYMETDLHATIRANILDEIHKQYIMYQAFKALAYMHSASLIHRDMKPANLLLNSECLMKVADFGLARSLNSMLSSEDRMDTMTDYVATRWYRAPEILVGSTQYGAKADLWSLGCIFGEMINAKPVFGGTSTLNQLEVISELLGHPSPEQVASLKSTFATTMYENVSGSGSESGSEGGIAALPEKERKARFVTKFPTVRPRRRPLTRTGTERCRLRAAPAASHPPCPAAPPAAPPGTTPAVATTHAYRCLAARCRRCPHCRDRFAASAMVAGTVPASKTVPTAGGPAATAGAVASASSFPPILSCISRALCSDHARTLSPPPHTQASPDAIDLLMSSLMYDPEKRISPEEGMVHPYCVQFHDTESVATADKHVESTPSAAVPSFQVTENYMTEVNDNKKLETKMYRTMLHQICDAMPKR